MRRVPAFVLAALAACSVSAQDARETQPSTSTQVEEIYVVRSVPESSTTPTEFCARERTGLGGATFEGQYTFRSTATRTSDGRMIDTNVRTIGSLHICGDRATPDSITYKWYGEGTLGGTSFKGIGECHVGESDFPERGLRAVNCLLDLSGLPSGYVGGVLTSNTLWSRKPQGMSTDPPGYTQASIATIRLWRKRDAPSSAMTQTKESLVGTWKLVSITQTTEKGEVEHFWGENPTGFLTYTSDDRVSVVIAGSDRKPSSTSPPPSGQRPEGFPTFMAYAGSYTLAGDKVIHHIEVCSAQDLVNTEQVRSVKLQGNRLTLRWGASHGGWACANRVHRLRLGAAEARNHQQVDSDPGLKS
jgi:Lipocalin-like domain